MIEKFDQIFPANVRWAMLALILVAILVAIEGIWKPARRFWQWVIAPPTCDNCGGTEFRLQPGWTPEMLYSFLCLRDTEGMSKPFLPPLECVHCGKPYF